MTSIFTSVETIIFSSWLVIGIFLLVALTNWTFALYEKMFLVVKALCNTKKGKVEQDKPTKGVS
jgi:hypothetical protein